MNRRRLQGGRRIGYSGGMDDVTQVLDAIERGDPQAAGRLLPLVYNNLRRLAAQMLIGEKPGQTLQATALVHEAYVRLVGKGDELAWNSRGHFFSAAAEAEGSAVSACAAAGGSRNASRTVADIRPRSRSTASRKFLSR